MFYGCSLINHLSTYGLYENVAVLQTGKLQLIELLEAMQKLLLSVAMLGSQAVCFLLHVFEFSFWLLGTVILWINLMQ